MSVYIYMSTYQWIRTGGTRENIRKKNVRKRTFKLP